MEQERQSYTGCALMAGCFVAINCAALYGSYLVTNYLCGAHSASWRESLVWLIVFGTVLPFVAGAQWTVVTLIAGARRDSA